MATRTVPLLPCASIDEIAEFYTSIGFRIAYRQRTPNPYVAVELDDLSLHYFGIEGFVPEDSYGSCLVLVDDTEPLFRIFEEGLKTKYGKLPLTGYPRITRPRARRNAGGLSGFSLIDPSGNWIRVMRDEPSRGAVVNADIDGGRLAQALANAVVLADSHGTVGQAIKILDGALTRERNTATAAERVEALAFLAELHVRAGDLGVARERLDELDSVELSDGERMRLAPVLGQARQLRDIAG